MGFQTVPNCSRLISSPHPSRTGLPLFGDLQWDQMLVSPSRHRILLGGSVCWTQPLGIPFDVACSQAATTYISVFRIDRTALFKGLYPWLNGGEKLRSSFFPHFCVFTGQYLRLVLVRFQPADSIKIHPLPYPRKRAASWTLGGYRFGLSSTVKSAGGRRGNDPDSP